MRNLSLVLLLILIGAGIYGYVNNPAACRKLGTDALANLTTIFTPGSGTSSPASPPATLPIPPGDLPVKHWQQGFVTQQAGTTPPPAPVTRVAAPATPAAPRVYTDNDFTDYSDALAASQARQLPMLILFTGSDWCPVCQVLDREVLSSRDFQQYVDSHFVFLTVDDLRNTPVMDDEKKRVTGLEQKFGVSLFPSLLIVGSDEKVIGRIAGYDPGSGPAAVIRDLDKLLHK